MNGLIAQRLGKLDERDVAVRAYIFWDEGVRWRR